jgi:hypothetical protein
MLRWMFGTKEGRKAAILFNVVAALQGHEGVGSSVVA